MAENTEIEKAEKSKGIPFSRRSVFAGLGLMLFSSLAPEKALAKGDMSLDELYANVPGTKPLTRFCEVPTPFSFSDTNNYGRWVWLWDQIGRRGIYQASYYWLEKTNQDRVLKCWVKLETERRRANFFVYNSVKYVYVDGAERWNSGIDYGVYYSTTHKQEGVFTISGGGRHHITSWQVGYKNPNDPIVGSTGDSVWDFWVVLPWYVYFKTGYGKNDVIKTESCTPDTAATPPANPTRSGYTFTGWDTPHANYQKVNRDMTITATWKANPTVHFMLNDENGNTRELCSTTVIGGSRLDTNNGGFSTAYNKIAQIYGGEEAKYTRRWHEGNQWGAWDWNKKFGSKTVTGETWIWAEIRSYGVQLFSDGTDDKHLVFSQYRIPAGRKFTIPASAKDKARKGNCNLNADYGTTKGSGFLGWYKNPELTVPAGDSVVATGPATIKLYARNRATLRVDYAPDSARPDPAADYRTAPRDDAPRYPRAMELPVFGSEPAHRLDGVSLPATGDWADQHCCGYYGEVLTLPGFDTVYERLPEGRWRTFRAEGWSDPAAGASEAAEGRTERSSRSLLALRSAPSSGARVQMRQDSMRVVRWVESVNDGVDTSM